MDERVVRGLVADEESRRLLGSERVDGMTRVLASLM
jgi:hypothetical protein